MQLCIMHVCILYVCALAVCLWFCACVRACVRACVHAYVCARGWVGSGAGIQASGKVTFTPNKQLRFDWQETIHYTLSVSHRYLIRN